jgi:hypothetical protein
VTFFASGAANSSSTLNDVEPGLLGFLVVAALAVALVFLLRSMNKQFRKIGPRPEEPESVAADEANTDEADTGEDAAAGATRVGADALKADTAVKPDGAESDTGVPDTGVGFVPDTGPKTSRR